MTTLDVIAAHTEPVIAEVAAAQDAAAAGPGRRRPGRRDGAGRARAARRASRPRSRSRSPRYQADFARLSAAEQAAGHHGRRRPRAQRRRATCRCPGGAAGGPSQTALAQVGDPYARGRRARRVRLLRADHVRLRRRRHLLPHSSRAQSPAGHPGLPRRPAARRPGVLLLADQPRGPLHRQRHDGARPHLRLRRSRSPASTSAASASASASSSPAHAGLSGSAGPRPASARRAAIRLARVAGVAAVCTRHRTA